jgi:hypothetical protein
MNGKKEPGRLSMTEQDIITLISDDEWMMHVLRLVRSLELPDWCVCAGFVRTKVWDYLHGLDSPTPLSDVDVVYFDPNHASETTEKEYEKILSEWDSSIPWSVKNQARMHTKNGHAPYVSTSDALANFTEVCTAVGAYLDSDDQVKLIAPYGISDLVNLIVRPTPFFATTDKREVFERRVDSKRWRLTWYRLKIIRF